MKLKSIFAVSLASAALAAHAQIIVADATYSTYVSYGSTGPDWVFSQGNTGTNPDGGLSTYSASGTINHYGVDSYHYGEASMLTSNTSTSMSGSAFAHSLTTYIGGSDSYHGPLTDSGFSTFVHFSVATDGMYHFTEDALRDIYHQYDPNLGPGSYFLTFYLYNTVEHYVFYNQSASNSQDFAGVPFEADVLMVSGRDYELGFLGATNAASIQYVHDGLGSGTYGETSFNANFSVQGVPEPLTLAVLLPAAAFALRRRHRR